MSENIIEIKNLYKIFGNFYAVNDISFNVKKGEIFGFLGANGAGKTTAIKILCGLSYPSKGEGMVAGFDIRKENEKIKQNIGYMSQKFSLYEDLKVWENIYLFGRIYGLSKKEIKLRTELLLKRLNFEDKQDALVSSLPLGWRQKLAFCIANFHSPKVIFLDEPTGGVDPITRRQFWELIHESAQMGTSVFITTHYMDEAEYCDRVSIMVDGKIVVLGTPQELKTKFNVLSMDEVFYIVATKKR
ncbi:MULTISPECIES: ABC transporter ATP-binding protein [unclassified Campylobacter]|uniref:ABC transporter ATP-binding protein n=1 Tax=unclassified Campylobacter TaxID=2593542 RepID=UPI0012381F56|nr:MULTISPECIES: ABC transporter ATP-binding protein [unclassified Campylobacter]KAA6227240.1 ABC transporter ATP-binding protein [Campylobacter sp. LR286c]KAA6227886.1 ABC transporter ATP-binding protein [Campylobacter sp. LR185c]KAA6228294.1 ABC transporter ATP-binding protein [Campylobacter sp. LR196d]KAA6229296.1 ABC transporter ATP-binding protein [Campylobacter sp. LR291e]KAA6231102.1 ABC transporter ATP-binding protein [Campylobacter sp. LR264d]